LILRRQKYQMKTRWKLKELTARSAVDCQSKHWQSRHCLPQEKRPPGHRFRASAENGT